MVNIAQVGVDPKSGAPINQRSTSFTFNNDVNGTTDIFYHFGSRLKSSAFINPNSTQFLTANRLADSGGNPTIVGVGDNAVDNSALTALFSASTDANSGLQVQFTVTPFVLNNLLINSDNFTWTVEGSNDGSAWTIIPQGSVFGPAAGWFYINISNATAYSYYRLLHGEGGTPKDLNTVKFFGDYVNGDFSPAIQEEATIFVTHQDSGVFYLPDALDEVFPTNYYVQVIHSRSGGSYTFDTFSGGGTPINDTTNGSLNTGDIVFAIFNGTQWNVSKVGGGVDIVGKGSILTSSGSQTENLTVGTNGTILRANSAESTGLEWGNIGYPDLLAPTAAIDVNGQPITGLPLFPVAPSEAVSKNYADSIAAGFDPKESCEVATTTDLDTETGLTWTPAGASVGKTLTSNGAAATIDGVPLVNNYRVLVKDQTPSSDNGIYDVSGVGSTIVLTRATDFDRTEVVSAGAFTFITEGIQNISTGFILVGTGNFSVDTSPLNFSKFVGSGALNFNSLSDVNVGSPGPADDGKIIGWNDSNGFFEFIQKAGTQIGDLVQVEDVSGSPGYPAIDGTQITLDSSQVTPLTTKGDIWVYDTDDQRLPVGTDNQFLTALNSEATGLIWKGLASTGLAISSTATDLTVEFAVSGANTLLGPLTVPTALAPNNNEFLRYNGTEWIATDPTGNAIGDIIAAIDVGGNAGLPALDGSNLTNLTIGAGQGSPLTTKGDLYIFDTANKRLPVGADDTILVADSTTTEGLTYKDVRDVSRFTSEITGNYTIATTDEKSTIRANSVSAIDITAPVGLAEGFYFFVQNQGTGTVTIVNDGSSTILGSPTIYGTADMLFVSNIGLDTWLVSSTGLTELATKGDLATFSTEPAVLPVGTQGQKLVANPSSTTGLEWQTDIPIEDELFAVNIPPDVLSFTVDDIIEYIGTQDGTTTYTNPFNNEISVLTGNVTDRWFDQTSTNISLVPSQANTFQFLEHKIKPTRIAVHQGDTDQTLAVEVSNDNSLWTSLGSLVLTGLNSWFFIDVSTSEYWSYLRLVPGATAGNVTELKIFGFVSTTPAQGGVISGGTTGLEQTAPGADDLVLVSDSSTPSGVKWDVAPTTILKLFVTETTMSGTLQLTDTDENIQAMDPNGSDRIVVLPNPPIAGLYFKLINTDAANNNIDIEETLGGGSVKTLDINSPYVECHYTGSSWLILD